jgi:Predicted esterase
MALLQASFHARTLRRKVPIEVILPTDHKESREGDEERKFKTLYLLHGIFGDCMSWIAHSRIEMWAEERDLAVVMPSGDNSFYIDRPYELYGEYVGRELVEATRLMFPLSRRREDTFIAGLSMGGYGALRNGLKYSETFGYVAGLSSALVMEAALGMGRDAPLMLQNRAYFEQVFGDLEAALKSDKNPKHLVHELVAKKRADPSIELPELFLACGTDDGLIGANRNFRDFLRGEGIDVAYREGSGCHDWEYWDRTIREVLDWLPLDPVVVEAPQRA